MFLFVAGAAGLAVGGALGLILELLVAVVAGAAMGTLGAATLLRVDLGLLLLVLLKCGNWSEVSCCRVSSLAVSLCCLAAFLIHHEFLNVVEVEIFFFTGEDLLLYFIIIEALDQLIEHHLIAVVILVVAGVAGAGHRKLTRPGNLLQLTNVLLNRLFRTLL